MNFNSPEIKGRREPYRRVAFKITLFLISLTMVAGISLTAFSGLSVTPLLLDLTIVPGGSGSGVLTVQNTGEKPVLIESQVQGFKTSEKGVARFLSGTAAKEYPYSGEKLLTLTPGEAVLKAGKSKEFTYEVSYPKDLDPFGGRYVGALFKGSPIEEDQEKSKGSSIKVATRVGTLILIRPSEEILIGEEFREFKVNPKIKDFYTRTVYSGKRLLIHTLLHNAGNIHIREKEFTGKIRIEDSSGSLVEEIKMAPHNVLPDTSYALTELWKISEKIKQGDPEKHTVRVLIQVQTPYGNVVELKESQNIEL